MAERNGEQRPPVRPESVLPLEVAPMRRLLFEAHAIVQVSAHALESKLEGLDATSVIDALQVAGRLIDDVAAAMEKARWSS